jgi:hypothetical protein
MSSTRVAHLPRPQEVGCTDQRERNGRKSGEKSCSVREAAVAALLVAGPVGQVVVRVPREVLHGEVAEQFDEAFHLHLHFG